MKRIMISMIAVMTALCSTGSVFAWDVPVASVDLSELDAFRSEYAIASYVGNTAPAPVKSYLLDCDVEVAADTLVEVVPAYNESGQNVGTGILVVNVEGDTAFLDTLLPFFKEEGSTMVMDAARAVDLTFPVYYDAYPEITIHGTVECKKYNTEMGQTLFSPQGFILEYDENEPCTVEYLDAEYHTNGTECYTSNFEETSAGYVEHIIYMSETYPTPNTIYGEYDPYDSGKAINIASSSPEAGMFMHLYFSIDGYEAATVLGVWP